MSDFVRVLRAVWGSISDTTGAVQVLSRVLLGSDQGEKGLKGFCR